MGATMGMILKVGLSVLLACGAPLSVQAQPPEKPHLVYVALQADDGTLSQETQVRCDLTLACDVAVQLGMLDVETAHLRIFAEDGAGFSVVPTCADREGNQAIGRRRDVGWGPRQAAVAVVAIRPLRPADEDMVTMFGLVVRENLPPVAQVMIAVKALQPSSGQVTQ
jgi:hypothetical protein